MTPVELCRRLSEKFQFIAWPEWQGISFTVSRGSLSFIYDWFLFLGWFEIRKWRKPITQREIDDYYRKKEAKDEL